MKRKKLTKEQVKRRIQTISVWIAISLVLQFCFYFVLEKKISAIFHTSYTPVTQTFKVTIPNTNINTIALSFEKDYLAFMEDDILKVLNLKTEQIVFEKSSPVKGDDDYGVLSYQWLPDRNTLIYFYGLKNPNPTSTIKVPIKDMVPEDMTAEDPNTKKETQYRTEIKQNNKRIIDLYTLELPDSSENTPPDDRFNTTLDQDLIPDQSKIRQVVVSTNTNLIYMTLQTNSGMRLLEIDVMKDISTLSRNNESITDMVASELYGTLYIKSQANSKEQILSLWNKKRTTIVKDASKTVLLGNKQGQLYLGELSNDHLVKILKAEESKNDTSLSFSTLWEGKIPYTDAQCVISQNGRIIVYNQSMAYIIENGKEEQVALAGDANYISLDGYQLVQIINDNDSTTIELIPLVDENKE